MTVPTETRYCDYAEGHGGEHARQGGVGIRPGYGVGPGSCGFVIGQFVKRDREQYPSRDRHGRDANQMHQHYATVPLFGGQTMGFPSPVDIELLVKTARHAALFMGYIVAFREGVVPHILDNDENPGEYLREDLRALGFWED